MHSVCVVELMSLSHNNTLMSNSCRRQQCILPGAAPFAQCPSDAQFGWADRNDRSVVVQLISLCQCCTRSEGTDQSWSSSNCYIFWVCVCIVVWLSCMQTAALYCRLWAVRLYHSFTHCLIYRTIFRKKGTEHEMCVLIFYTNFVWHIILQEYFRDTLSIVNVHGFSYKLPDIIVRF